MVRSNITIRNLNAACPDDNIAFIRDNHGASGISKATSRMFWWTTW